VQGCLLLLCGLKAVRGERGLVLTRRLHHDGLEIRHVRLSAVLLRCGDERSVARTRHNGLAHLQRLLLPLGNLALFALALAASLIVARWRWRMAEEGAGNGV
jgi:hypothetical protein